MRDGDFPFFSGGDKFALQDVLSFVQFFRRAAVHESAGHARGQRNAAADPARIVDEIEIDHAVRMNVRPAHGISTAHRRRHDDRPESR